VGSRRARPDDATEEEEEEEEEATDATDATPARISGDLARARLRAGAFDRLAPGSAPEGAP